MILSRASDPWIGVHARLAAGDQVLRIIDCEHGAAGELPRLAMLLDRDTARLAATAARFGVRRVRRRVQQRGESNQYVEVWGRPLARMLAAATQGQFMARSAVER